MESYNKNFSVIKITIVLLVVLLALYISSIYSYLFFHLLAEIISIIIGVSIFLFLWINRYTIKINFYIILGVSSFFISIIDFFHTLSYKGMDIFIGYDANLPTQLWIVARYIQAISVLLAIALSNKKISSYLLFLIYSIVTITVLSLIFLTDIFPDCFVEETGLTLFKIISEFVIVFILLVSIFFLFKNKRDFDPQIKVLFYFIIIFLILAELSFTLYKNDVYGLFNIIGHYFKIISNYLLLIGILEVGIKQPQTLLYLRLKNSEEALRKALDEVQELKGIIPICASCKKIRRIDGGWEQIEDYIREYSKAEFSHGLCPDCYKKSLDELD